MLHLVCKMLMSCRVLIVLYTNWDARKDAEYLGTIPSGIGHADVLSCVRC